MGMAESIVRNRKAQLIKARDRRKFIKHFSDKNILPLAEKNIKLEMREILFTDGLFDRNYIKSWRNIWLKIGREKLSKNEEGTVYSLNFNFLRARSIPLGPACGNNAGTGDFWGAMNSSPLTLEPHLARGFQLSPSMLLEHFWHFLGTLPLPRGRALLSPGCKLVENLLRGKSLIKCKGHKDPSGSARGFTGRHSSVLQESFSMSVWDITPISPLSCPFLTHNPFSEPSSL